MTGCSSRSRGATCSTRTIAAVHGPASNPWAARDIAEKLLEAAQRGMWKEPSLDEALLADVQAIATSRSRTSWRAPGHVSRAPFPLSGPRGPGRRSSRRCWSARCTPVVGGVLVRGERGTAKSTAVRGARADAAAGLLVVGRGVRLRSRASCLRAAWSPPTRRWPSALRRWSSCRSDDARSRSSGLSTWAEHRPASRPSSLASSPVRDGGDALRRRGQPPAATTSSTRSSTPPPRARSTGWSARRSSSVVHDGALPARRDDEPRGGRAAPAAPRPLRPRRRGRFPRRSGRAGRDRPPPACLRGRSRRLRRALAAGAGAAGGADRRRPRATRLGPAARGELLRITGACARLGVDGVRGDIVSARTARALAALDGVDEVSEDQVRRAAALALAHRRRRDPLDGGSTGKKTCSALSTAPTVRSLRRADDVAAGRPGDAAASIRRGRAVRGSRRRRRRRRSQGERARRRDGRRWRRGGGGRARRCGERGGGTRRTTVRRRRPPPARAPRRRLPPDSIARSPAAASRNSTPRAVPLAPHAARRSPAAAAAAAVAAAGRTKRELSAQETAATARATAAAADGARARARTKTRAAHRACRWQF